MYARYFVFIILAVLCTSCSSIQSQLVVSEVKEKPLYHYEPEIVSIDGNLQLKKYPGPPDYSDIKGGDRPESVWILNLVKPIIVTPKDGKERDGTYPVEKNIFELQLVFDYDKVSPKKLKLSQGKRFLITGTLFHSVTIHHRSTVLIWVQNAKRMK